MKSSARPAGWSLVSGRPAPDAILSLGDRLYGQIFSVVAPILIMTLVGFVLGRFNKTLDTRTISTLVLTIATPCLVFSTLTSLEIETATLFKMALAALLCVTFAAAIALPLLRILGMPYQTFLPCLMLPNSGNMGLPLVLLAFGDPGLALGISYFFVIALVQYTVGAAISSGQYRFQDLIRLPLVWSIALVLAVLITGEQVPEIIATSTKILGGMMIPTMLILLGLSLASLSISDLRPAIVIAVARLLIGLAVGLVVIWLLSLSQVEAGTVFLLASMPTAIVSYVFAERYRPDSQQVAGAVVVSTLFTFAVLPAVIWVAYLIAGIQVP